MKDFQINLFSTPTWGFKIDDEIKNISKYIEYLEQLESSDVKIQKSNAGGFQSRGDLHLDPFFNSLTSHIHSISSAILEQFTDRKCCLDSMWGNINYKYNYNQAHTHEGWLSGVFYLQAPEDCGSLVFTHPAVRSGADMVTSTLAGPNVRVNPEAGACVIFPSWLEHLVEQNLSDEKRVSISFNIGEQRT